MRESGSSGLLNASDLAAKGLTQCFDWLVLGNRASNPAVWRTKDWLREMRGERWSAGKTGAAKSADELQETEQQTHLSLCLSRLHFSVV